MTTSFFYHPRITILLKLLLVVSISLCFTILMRNKTFALSWVYPEYNVDIIINEDTTFKVTENAIFTYTGELNGLRRDIRLNNPLKESTCAKSPTFTCGGFEFLTFDSLVYNGKTLNEDEFNLYEVDIEDTKEKFFRVEKRIYDPAQTVLDETHEWEFSYNIYGGIQWLKNSEDKEVAYFYWNLLPENRGGPTKLSTIKIQFPKNIYIEESKFIVYAYSNIDYEYDIDDASNILTLTFENLSSLGDLTFAYEFSSTDLIKPGTISYQLLSPLIGAKTKIDGREFKASQDNQFRYFPAGKYLFSIEREGYQPFTQEIEVQSGRTINIGGISLIPTTQMSILIVAFYILSILGIVLIPFLLWRIYQFYKLKGVDKQMPKAIIPLFSPPENVRPYLLGSLKDEKVDQRDITGTLIDLAYRGFIKIKEEDKSNYTLFLLEGKNGETLNAIEQKLIDYLFNGSKEIKTKDLTYNSFGSKLPGLKNEIYQEMVSNGWFEESPEKTRGKYFAKGFGFFMLGIILGVVISIVITQLIGDPTFFTIGFAIAIYGITIVITSSAMPAKTALGSKIFAEVLGFKMYMETAERYRVQGLDPEEFVKYLSYAIVFGIESKWADTFKDIYKSQPDWYEGSSITAWDVWAIDRMSRGFMQSTEVSMTPVSASGGSSSGSGWSGGGSFGGFSGGGGGGGSSGGW